MPRTGRTEALPVSDCAFLAELLRAGGERSVQALPAGAAAHVIWAVRRIAAGPVVAVADAPPALDVLHEDLATLGAGDADIGYYPGWESLPGSGQDPPPELVGDRLAALHRFAAHRPPEVTLTTVQALMQRTLSPGLLRDRTLRISRGDEIDLDPWLETLQQAGYAFQVQVAARGDAARRGGIVDIWPPTEPWPLRLEFFGPELDSIRTFDPTDQRSLEAMDAVLIPPADEAFGSGGEPEPAGTLFDYLPAGMAWVWLDAASIQAHAEMFEQTSAELDGGDRVLSLRRVLELRTESRPAGVLVIGPGRRQSMPDHHLGIDPLEGVPSLPGSGAGPDVLERERGRFLAEVLDRRADGETVRLYLSDAGTRARFLEQYAGPPWRIDPEDVVPGRLSEGFRVPGAGLTAVAESDLYGQRKLRRGRYDLHARRKGPSRLAAERIEAWTDLQPGELVVHVDHGIGRYLGLYEMAFPGGRQEVLTVEYDQGARLQLPVSQAHLLTRYAGAGAAPPRLHRLGGRRWSREKQAVQSSVRDLASAMLETQAAREVKEGFAFSPDQPWQHEFEAAFPYEETPDQHRAIDEVKRDMELPRPMDRLVCGDVGYGKTEVALRAAFKAVLDGKQVAVLVPTTILAQQHYDTFSARTAAFPFTIRMLSRFQTRGDQRRTVEGLASGAVDIVIGTHRLIQQDVRFRDLGLLIIDEEQRFGVEQKEFLKHMRQLVDVLTLSATPIPRTLYMSLMGTRDMSTIQSPPQERLPIHTHVGPADDEVIRRAVLRECNRGGQVYFLHNRVATIRAMEEKLRALIPEATLAVGHGQMHEQELAAVMRDFVQGRYDVLLCTTIIESGVDIPNVNTIIIDRADRFGLSELYQLRGRVGRYKHQAYAYLLLPKGGRLMDTARQRIRALQKYGSLGAGFKLALKDLEIRGTGNLLGAEQSGHITAVGFELYCQFLKRTVAQMKGDEVPPLIEVELKLDFLEYAPGAADSRRAAVIPAEYVPDEDLRVQAYRKLAMAATEPALDLLLDEFADRFGPPPHALRRLVAVSRIRILAARRRITHIETRGEKIMMTRDRDYLKDGARFPRMEGTDPDDKLRELTAAVRAVRP